MPIAFTGDRVATDRHASGLIAHWKGPNFAWDQSGNGNTCIVNFTGLSAAGANLQEWGGPHSAGAHFSEAATQGGRIVHPSQELLTWQVPFTICAWARATSATTNGSVFSQYRSLSAHKLIRILGYAASEFAYYYSKADGTFQSHSWGSVPTLGVWHFLWAVVSGTLSAPTVRLGVDGAEKSFTGVGMSTTPDTSVVPFISATNSSGGIAECRDGEVGSIRLYHRDLSGIELRQIMGESSQSLTAYARSFIFIPSNPSGLRGYAQVA